MQDNLDVQYDVHCTPACCSPCCLKWAIAPVLAVHISWSFACQLYGIVTYRQLVISKQHCTYTLASKACWILKSSVVSIQMSRWYAVAGYIFNFGNRENIPKLWNTEAYFTNFLHALPCSCKLQCEVCRLSWMQTLQHGAAKGCQRTSSAMQEEKR